MTDRSFERRNDESRERLGRVIGSFTPAQLEIDLGEGWTVASALAHAGFWDRWQAARWTRMLAGDWTAEAASVIEAEHLADVALRPYWAGISSGELAKIALEAAASLDALIAAAPDSLVEALEGTPEAYLLHRHRHRNDHLDQVERSIAAAAGASVDRKFVATNATSRIHLAAVVSRLRDEHMALSTEPTEEGSWTVAQVLGHLLFWDRSMEARWQLAVERAGADGPLDIIGIPFGSIEAVNRPLAGLIGSWTRRLGLAIGAETLAAAEAVDALAEKLADRLAPGTLTTRPGAVNRAGHRESHLAQIQRALGESMQRD